MDLFHWTHACEAIVHEGFRGRSGSYGMDGHVFEDVVWFSDDGRVGLGHAGGQLVRVGAPGDLPLNIYEVEEPGNLAREWAIPAALVNTWPRCVVDQG